MWIVTALSLSNIFAVLIQKIFNSNLSECYFPKELKAGEVSSLFKSLDAFIKKNYRPITVLSFYRNRLSSLSLKGIIHFGHSEELHNLNECSDNNRSYSRLRSKVRLRRRNRSIYLLHAQTNMALVVYHVMSVTIASLTCYRVV